MSLNRLRCAFFFIPVSLLACLIFLNNCKRRSFNLRLSSQSQRTGAIFFHWQDRNGNKELLEAGGFQFAGDHFDGLNSRGQSAVFNQNVLTKITGWYDNSGRRDAGGAGLYVATDPFASMSYGEDLLIVEIESNKPLDKNNISAYMSAATNDSSRNNLDSLPLITNYGAIVREWMIFPRVPNSSDGVKVLMRPPTKEDAQRFFAERYEKIDPLKTIQLLEKDLAFAETLESKKFTKSSRAFFASAFDFDNIINNLNDVEWAQSNGEILEKFSSVALSTLKLREGSIKNNPSIVKFVNDALIKIGADQLPQFDQFNHLISEVYSDLDQENKLLVLDVYERLITSQSAKGMYGAILGVGVSLDSIPEISGARKQKFSQVTKQAAEKLSAQCKIPRGDYLPQNPVFQKNLNLKFPNITEKIYGALWASRIESEKLIFEKEDELFNEAKQLDNNGINDGNAMIWYTKCLIENGVHHWNAFSLPYRYALYEIVNGSSPPRRAKLMQMLNGFAAAVAPKLSHSLGRNNVIQWAWSQNVERYPPVEILGAFRQIFLEVPAFALQMKVVVTDIVGNNDYRISDQIRVEGAALLGFFADQRKINTNVQPVAQELIALYEDFFNLRKIPVSVDRFYSDFKKLQRNIKSSYWYSEVSRIFLLVDPIFVSEDLRHQNAIWPFERFNESYNLPNGETRSQLTWQNYLSAWEIATLSYFGEFPLEKKEPKHYFSLGSNCWRLCNDTIIETLLAGLVEGFKTVSYTTWDRRIYKTDFLRSTWDRALQEQSKSEIEKFFIVEEQKDQMTLKFKPKEEIVKSFVQFGSESMHATHVVTEFKAGIETDPIRKAAQILYLLPKLHPYKNGNGRFARMMASQVLLRAGYPIPVALPTNDFLLSFDRMVLEVRKAVAIGKYWTNFLTEASDANVDIKDFFQKFYRGSSVEALSLMAFSSISELNEFVEFLESQKTPPVWAVNFLPKAEDVLNELRRSKGNVSNTTEATRDESLIVATSAFLNSIKAGNGGKL